MRASRLAWSFLILAVLAFSAPAYADQHQNSSNLSLSLNGGTLSVGDQFYSQHGGSLLAGLIQGTPVDPSQATFEFGLRAHVSGAQVHGDASFNIAINNPDGSVTKVEGDAPINDMIPAASFPDGSTVPAMFVGIASITVQTCSGQHQDSHASPYDVHDNEGNNCNTTNQFSTLMEFESAYLNPNGAPILMTSPDGTTMIVSTYSQASIVWKGIQLGGIVSETVDGNPVVGSFAMTVTAHEDLLAGTESEKGSISMSLPSLNAKGHFDGQSTIPPGSPCPAILGFPPGTCASTGLDSLGSFSMHSSQGDVDGSYSITWDAPAFSFHGLASATVGGNEGNGGD